MNKGGTGMICKCPHHKITPLLVVLFGFDFLLNQLGWISDGLLAISWPALIIVAGVIKMTEGKCRCC